MKKVSMKKQISVPNKFIKTESALKTISLELINTQNNIIKGVNNIIKLCKKFEGSTYDLDELLINPNDEEEYNFIKYNFCKNINKFTKGEENQCFVCSFYDVSTTYKKLQQINNDKFNLLKNFINLVNLEIENISLLNKKKCKLSAKRARSNFSMKNITTQDRNNITNNINKLIPKELLDSKKINDIISNVSTKEDDLFESLISLTQNQDVSKEESYNKIKEIGGNIITESITKEESDNIMENIGDKEEFVQDLLKKVSEDTTNPFMKNIGPNLINNIINTKK